MRRRFMLTLVAFKLQRCIDNRRSRAAFHGDTGLHVKSDHVGIRRHWRDLLLFETFRNWESRTPLNLPLSGEQRAESLR